jgi:hypothetical protein
MARFVLTAQLQLQAPNNVAQVVRQIQSQLNNVNVNVQVQNSQQAQRQLQQITQSTNQATTAAGRMGKAFAVSVRRFAAFSIATRAVGLFTSTLSDAVQTAIDFERQLIKVAQVTGKSVGELRNLTNEITNLSTGLGVSSQSLLEVSTILAQAGLSANDTKIALNALAKAALAPNFDSITETAEGAIAILAQFGQGVEALESQLGSINAVAGAFAVEASDLIDVIRRTGGVFKSSGGSLNELLALFTSVRATTRESAESIGTGLRTIFTRIQRPKTIEFLKQFGVELLDLEGKFVGPYEAVRRLSEGLAGLGERDITFIKIAEELGGFRQIGKVLPLLQQFATAESALNVATKANNSLSQDAASAQAALAVRITKVKEEFLALVRSVAETSTFQIMANTALALASSLVKIADSIKPLLPLLAAMAAIKIAKGFGSFASSAISGLQSSRTFNKGGKVHHFARGGMVPGIGNRDTVPAMLSPGEFVIRKSSVNKLGASNLAGMNEGGGVPNRYAAGGIVVDPTKIGAFFLRPEEGIDRSGASMKGNVQITNNAVLKRLGMGTSKADARQQAFDKLTKERQASLLGLSTVPAGKIDSSKLFKNGNVNLTSSISSPGRQALRDKGVSKEDVDNIDVKRVQSRLNRGIEKGKLAVDAKSVPMSGSISSYFPGKSDLETSSISNIVAENTRKGLYNAVLKSVDPALQLLNNPVLSVSQQQARGGASKISNDPNARSTTEGFIFEGLIKSITGAKLSGNQANFDFKEGSMSSSKPSLKAMFANKSGEGIDSLVKADAKRSNSRSSIDSIKNKIANDINANRLEGVSFVAKNLGGLIQKFATGGGVGTDTIPALLTPGEFVVNRSSAQSIGYGNLNRMNKVGKYAKGGVVQKFATGTAGTGAKPVDFAGAQAFNLNPKVFTVLEKTIFSLADVFRGVGSESKKTIAAFDFIRMTSSELVDTIRSNSIANNRTKTTQEAITVAYEKLITGLYEEGKQRDQIEPIIQKYIDALNKDTQSKLKSSDKTSSSSSVSSPTTSSPRLASPGDSAAGLIRQSQSFQESVVGSMSQKEAAMMQASMKKNTTAYDKFAVEIERMNLETKDNQVAFKSFRRSLDKGLSTQEAYNVAMESLHASVTKSGKVMRESPTPAPSASQAYKAASSPIEKQQVYMEAKASRGKLTTKDIGAGLGVGMSQAQAKAIIATNQQAMASQKAAQANNQEASASERAAQADNKEAMSSMGGVRDFGNLAMGLSLVSGTIQSMLPPLEENSSVFLKMAHSGLTLATTLSGIVFALSAFGISINGNTIASAASAATSFLMGTAGAAASSATLSLAGSATLASIALQKTAASSFFSGILDKVSLGLTKFAPFAKAIVNATGPILGLAASGFAGASAVNLLVSEIYDVSGKLKEAIDKGNTTKTAELAGQQYDLEAGNTTRLVAGVVTAIGVGLGTSLGAALGTFAGPVAGNIAGGVIGGIVGAAAATAVINTFDGISEFVNVAFGGNTRDSVIALAVAQAQGVKTQEALNKAGELVTQAMTDLENGSISAAKAVAASEAAGSEVIKQRKGNQDAAQKNEQNKSGVVGGFLRGALRVGTLGLAGYMGVESGAQRNTRIDKENQGLSEQTKKSEEDLITKSMPAINAFSSEIAAAGGSFDDVLASMNDATSEAFNPGLYQALINQGTNPLKKSFDNIKKEVDRAKKAFEAMNLGMQNVQGAASAAALGVSNYVASQEAGNVGLEQSLATLEASITTAAQGISDADFSAALGDAEQTLRKFGANDKQVTDFKNNLQAVNAVQRDSGKIFADTKDELSANIRKSGSADERKKAFSQSIGKSLKAQGFSDEIIQKFKDASSNLSDEQLKKIGQGDFTVFDEAIKQLGETTLNQINGPMKAAIEIQKQLNGITQKRIEIEKELASSQVNALNVRMEARDIQAKYGGKAVTPEERRQNIIDRANIQAGGIGGVNALKTGSAEEIAQKNRELATRQAQLGNVRNMAAAGNAGAASMLEGEAGLSLQEEERKLAQAAQNQLETTRELIKAKEQELQITQEKNKLEKQSLESLITGDIEKFFEQQASVGATAAIATGNQDLMNQFGASALAGAYTDIQRQQEAGVQSIYGQQIGGAGGLGQQAAGAALAARGIQSPIAAQMLAGTTPEEEGIKAEIRGLAETMGPTADLQTQAANLQLQAAQMQYQAASQKGSEAVAQMQARQMARGGAVYASNGIFVPRGTDTVPAMLTPGEFVVNRGAVNRGNNLQILRAINSGSSPSALMSKGGKVGYYNNGGVVQYKALGDLIARVGQAVGIDPKIITNLGNVFTSFTDSFNASIKNLQDTKFQIKLDTTNVNVNLNGGSFLEHLSGKIKEDLIQHIGKEISQYKVNSNGSLTKNSSTLPTG